MTSSPCFGILPDEPGLTFGDLEWILFPTYEKMGTHPSWVRGWVYVFFDCHLPHKGRRYVNRTRTSFQCVGCAWQCETDDFSDFQLFLPLEEGQNF